MGGKTTRSTRPLPHCGSNYTPSSESLRAKGHALCLLITSPAPDLASLLNLLSYQLLGDRNISFYYSPRLLAVPSALATVSQLPFSLSFREPSWFSAPGSHGRSANGSPTARRQGVLLLRILSKPPLKAGRARELSTGKWSQDQSAFWDLDSTFTCPSPSFPWYFDRFFILLMLLLLNHATLPLLSVPPPEGGSSTLSFMFLLLTPGHIYHYTTTNTTNTTANTTYPTTNATVKSSDHFTISTGT